MKKSVLGAGLALCTILSLTGCGSGEAASTASLSEIQEKYPAIIKNEGTPVEGQMLKVGYISDSPFKGIFNPVFYTSGDDGQIMENAMNGAFTIGPDFKLVLDSDETPINVHIDTDKKEITYKINPKFKWNDGTPVTTDDIIRTYEILANADFIKAAQSPRFDPAMYIIEGINDYNEGKASKISGLEKISDSEMKIHVSEVTPGVYYGGATVGEFVKASSLEGIPMDKIMESDAFRKNPPSYGPYYISNIIPGEHVTFTANPYYYKGEAKIKTIDLEVIPSSQSVKDIETGGHDIYIGTGADVWSEITQFNNISIATRPSLYMAYMGFNQGTWDSEKNECVTDPNAKMNNPALKRALGLAIDNATIGNKFYHGLRFPATSAIAPVFTDYYNASENSFPYDPEKAKQILDEAGYKDVDGDGFREDPQGQPLVISLAMMSGGETAEPLSKYYLQAWENIGIKCHLVDDRLIEFNDFYDRVKRNDPSIDVFMAAFGLASDPNPTGYWSKNAGMNHGRYTSEKMENILNKISSTEAVDPAKAKEFYAEYEKIFNEELPVVPTMCKLDFIVVNKRVMNYNFSYADETGFDWSKIEVSANDPIVNQ